MILVSSFSTIQKKRTEADIKLITTETEFEVGNSICLRFSTSEVLKPKLYCSNSYGSTLITPTLNNAVLEFKIPLHISNKKGVVNWKLLNKSTSISGNFNIRPKQQVRTMETYIGPPSIEAGGRDYTMLVVIPTDSLDNPLPEETLVQTKHQFLSTEKSEEIVIKNMIAYKNIYSQKESGRMLLSSESLKTNSKEFMVNVTAAIPTDFSISSKRPHEYADGNQITTFSTSVIRDKYNNIVSDGTYITFYITTEKGAVLKTTGTTIKGIATSYMLHPDHESKWQVKAYVNGIAESNTITLNYKKVIADFDVLFSKTNRTIRVGPLQSFMQQMIPDGLEVTLSVYKDKLLLKTFVKTSYNGFVDFNLKPGLLKNDTYTLKIKTAGLEKTFDIIKLW